LVVNHVASYSDGVVTIRPLCTADIDSHLAAQDEEQIAWLWEPGQRETWAAMTPAEQRRHVLRYLAAANETFGPGPKWCFAVDTIDVAYVAYVDCDLVNAHVPSGDANIAYSAHPAYRGFGYVSRAVRLVLRFLAEHTAAARAHIIVDKENVASLRVARAVGASVTEEWQNEQGRTMVRHVLELSRGTSPGHVAPT
jgi:RimJ/RimL family protein N-acetyltransferase